MGRSGCLLRPVLSKSLVNCQRRTMSAGPLYLFNCFENPEGKEVPWEQFYNGWKHVSDVACATTDMVSTHLHQPVNKDNQFIGFNYAIWKSFEGFGRFRSSREMEKRAEGVGPVGRPGLFHEVATVLAEGEQVHEGHAHVKVRPYITRFLTSLFEIPESVSLDEFVKNWEANCGVEIMKKAPADLQFKSAVLYKLAGPKGDFKIAVRSEFRGMFHHEEEALKLLEEVRNHLKTLESQGIKNITGIYKVAIDMFAADYPNL